MVTKVLKEVMNEANSLGINPFILYREAGDINGTIFFSIGKNRMKGGR
ncbi:hypothetical protein [Capnocytophaga cynodegmi]